MTGHYRITPRAAQDLKTIGRYTLKHWGKEQRNSYVRALDRRFVWLAKNPRMGRHRTDVKDGYYSYPQGAHVVFYLVRNEGIDIIGIPHHRMDVMNYFVAENKSL
ncbi:type II toxin-antitoxin system RelE/ParE family toxin [bacterium endosymbiont of Escarpia laminata]|nr:MAG: type II toxin-antitoxin system RelE/ParE family toxin [bacterium endosymbiont of Escarpia laminata]